MGDRFYNPVYDTPTGTSWPATSSFPLTTADDRDPYSCEGYCRNAGVCSLTGPGLTAVCSCTSGHRGQICEEVVLWFEFFVRDNQLTGNGVVLLLCICIAVSVLSFAGVLFYRHHRRRKSKTREKAHFEQNTNPIFDDVHATSRQELLVYQVAQPALTSPPPTPCSPQGQGICYLVPTSPEPTPAPDAAWQDFHNPGYRQSYIDSGV